MVLYILLGIGIIGMVMVSIVHTRQSSEKLFLSIKKWCHIDSHRFDQQLRSHYRHLARHIHFFDRVTDRWAQHVDRHIQKGLGHTKRYVRKKLFVKNEGLPYSHTFIKQIKERE